MRILIAPLHFATLVFLTDIKWQKRWNLIVV
jgi:hypothetical protein